MTEAFGSQSTTDEVLAGVNLNGKRVLVTGVSAGLGVETARALAAHGAEVVGAARDLEKAKRATGEVERQAKHGFDLVELDLASLKSVRACADALLKAGRPFDLVIANAGVAGAQGRTADGFEIQFGVNHLGHFLLVNRIASLMPPGARLINLSSGVHRQADLDLDDLDNERGEPRTSYPRSKTANILFTVEFDRRHRERGVRAAAINPGLVETELNRHVGRDTIRRFTEEFNARQRAEGRPLLVYKSIPQGAATTVWAAAVAKADEIGGRYCEDCHVAALTEGGMETLAGVRDYAIDSERAKALWAKSEALVGERF